MIALYLVTALVAVLLTGIPIFAGLAILGGAALFFMQGELGPVSDIIFHHISQYMLVTIPLFAFMAHVMIRAKIVDDLYETAYTFTRHLPGGLAIATISACMVFAAISGSSVATALTVGAVAIPQMIRFGYPPRLAYGLVAAGGTLGILIPPSGPMVLYGVISDTSIAGLFMAGVVPGLILGLMFIIWSSMSCAMSGHAIKRERRASLGEMFQALRKSVWAVGLPVSVMVGMYTGVFTATEAAAIGAMLATAVAALAYRNVNMNDIWQSALSAAQTSAMLFMIVGGASIFAHVVTLARIPQQLLEVLVGMDIGVTGFLILMMVIIFILGTFLETVALILVTTPVILPVMAQFGINPIWYGILLTVNLELALITPPVGMNLFTIKGITNAPLDEIIRGAMPYVGVMIVGLALFMIWPQLVMWLPNTLMSR